MLTFIGSFLGGFFGYFMGYLYNRFLMNYSIRVEKTNIVNNPKNKDTHTMAHDHEHTDFWD